MNFKHLLLSFTRAVEKLRFLKVVQRKLITMPVLTIIIVLIVAGVLMYLINNYIPMDSKIKTLLNIVVIILLIIWLLKAFGILGSLSSIKV